MELLPDDRPAPEHEVRRSLQGEVRQHNRVTADPIEAGYNSVYIWAAAVEKAKRSTWRRSRRRRRASPSSTPEGKVTVDEKNQHVYKTARIGIINADGLIDEVWKSDAPIKPDPCLTGYKWATGLANGECS